MPKITRSHVTPYFERKFDRLPKNMQKITRRKLLLFEENPFYPSLQTHKLKGSLADFWAFWITKNYRVLFRFLKNNEVIYYDVDTHDIYAQ